jgi:DNA-directed RNA polymerase subunit RPC12/RpoP
MRECPYCGEAVMVGKRWFNHMCANHPDEWAVEMSRDLTAKYADAECPDCGALVNVKVTVEIERTCSCHSSPTWWCKDCGEDVPVASAADHLAADYRRSALTA